MTQIEEGKIRQTQQLNYLALLERIKKLEVELHDCKNELCYYCEHYKNDSCGDCRWRNL